MTKVHHQRIGEMPRLRVDEVGDALLVSVNGVHPATAAVARALPTEAGRICVVMTDPALAYHPELGHRLCRWVPVRYESVRLIAPCAAVADQSGRIPAQELSELLETDVVAPVGELVAVPGGTLYALPSTPGTADRRWLRYRPGRPPLNAGWRFPQPDWERALTEFTEPGIPEVTVEQIPSGLWIRRSHSPLGPVDPTDLAFAAQVEPDSVTLLVSRPGDPPLPATALRRVIEALPAGIRDQLVVTPYGDNPVADGPLGAVASAAAGRTLRVRAGLPLQLAGRGPQVTAIGADGSPAWIPFAREVAWRPHGGGRILSWTAPAEQLLPAGPAQFMLNERWVVEVLEAGLWIREANRSEGASVVRRLPLEAEHCTVVVGVGDEDQLPPPWRAVDRLLRRLAPDALARLRLAVPAAAGKWFAEATAKGLRRLPHGAPPLLLTSTGRLLAQDSGEHRAPVEPTAPGVSTTATPTTTSRQPADTSGRRVRKPVDEASYLLRYVDEIRRAQAWDEVPPAPAPAPAAPGSPTHRTSSAVPPSTPAPPGPPGQATAGAPTAPPAPHHRRHDEEAPSVPGEHRRKLDLPAPVDVPTAAPVSVVVPVAVVPADRDAGAEPTAHPARRATVAPPDGETTGRPNGEA
ncbi:hypothetical protein [Micromonospora echinofusca]|uniref:Uncharacterized protein n=1 Tax=Micromonospora echinofusca TaxID=47858 RepID=A0ABS3VWW0_MICEH|nr:hypothetical protein [Micromonospora echinofusca]MBO4209041.1 hypothetical protein [Micromonospora echinofusca]